MASNKSSKALLGAAFLMATSAVGPGFLTQTTVFTQQLATSFGFIILLTVIIDLCAQFNIWQIITVSGKRAQELANELFPGLGYMLAFLIVIGGFAFNIGNVAGAGLGLEAMTGMNVKVGAVLSAAIAIGIFLFKEAGKVMDIFSRVLGMLMIILILYIAFTSHPPLVSALHHTILPEKFDAMAAVTLVGGTVGGYISFAGAHRLLDSGISGEASLSQVNRSAATGILITTVIRYLLFLAALGVVLSGATINPENPTASIFEQAAGSAGRQIFGLVIWSAAITSVVGAAYTSISFVRSFHPFLEKYHSALTITFIAISTAVFAMIGKPVKVLVFVGTLNGFVLPVALATLLIASGKSRLMGTYKHSRILLVMGWLVVAVMAVLGFGIY
ncbi:NRAMP family divalent metal transporter [Dyadobacter fanqingshengii]|uniref:Divalent metal cation transporter n=1 Tax=Dyadobacter fanqingshengii TaxID=2906443 RepID=A0A9X1P5J8_9BACT|nr:NRAMP family divalent metal transporter [Dyadobacter fanqingshengii]MCF0038801.1 divalent metal cation transporter [Dyadobacter fanqingshengii]USJ34371.1 divalent metal cation transporter [Dyadobacter fanqingshengii]